MTHRAAHDERSQTTEAIVAWMTTYISKRLDIAQGAIPLDAPFTDYGIDSAFAVVMSGDIANWTGHDVPPNLLYEYPTINALAQHVASLK